MSLSQFDSFQSRFVTYLLNFPRNLQDDLRTFFTSFITDVTIVFTVALVTNNASINNDYFVLRIGHKVPMWRHFLT